MNKKKGFIKMLLVIVAIITVAVFIYIRMSYRTETIPNNVMNNKTNSSSQSREKDVTASWKTYRNDKYGFEVKYPSDYSFSEHPSKDNTNEFSVTFFNQKLKDEIDLGHGSDRIPPMVTVKYDKESNISWAESMYKYFGDKSDTQIKLLEENPREIKDLPVTDPVKFIVEPTIFLPGGYAFHKNGYSILIYASMYYTSEESVINLEKMLTTLKFTK